MNREYIVGTEFVNKQGVEHRVDITPDWQVWADQEKRLDNLDALSAVMIAGYAANLDRVLDTRVMYRNSFYEYHRLVDSSSAEPIAELEQDIQTRLGSVFSQSFGKIYKPVTSILNKNILPIKVLNPRYLLLLVSDMTDSERIVDAIRKSKIAETDSSNNAILQDRILGNLVTRGYISTNYAPQEVDERKPKTKVTQSKLAQTAKPIKPRNEHDTSPVQRHELQRGFTDVREYAGAMVEYIKETGSEPFDIDDLVEWAEEQGFNPNRGEIERRVLLAATNASLVKRTNVYTANKTAREMWVLL